MYNKKISSIILAASMFVSNYSNRDTDDCVRKVFSFEKTTNKGLSAKEMGTAGKKKSKAARKKNKKNKKRSA